MVAPTEWSEEDIEYLRKNYFYKSYAEMSQYLGISVSVLHRKAKEIGLPRKTERNRIEHEHGPICDLLEDMHWEQKTSVNEMADILGVSRKTINRWMEECGVEWRGRSAAEKLKWEQMTPEQRRQKLHKAHKRTRQLVALGEHILQTDAAHGGSHRGQKKRKPGENFRRLWANERDKMLKIARRAAPLGAPARERNGNNWMKGRTGPDNPNWRGGKDRYHRLRSLADGNWWRNRKRAIKRDDNTCQECGVNGATDDVIIDVHHIIPIHDGGTNELDNLVCLCRSCHIAADWKNGVRER